MLRLTDPVQYLKGVGPARAGVLAELGIRTVGDVLFYFPRDLSHLPGRTPIAHCRRQLGQVVTVAGTLDRCRLHGRPFKPVFSATLVDASGRIDCTWFNAGWLKGQFDAGDRVVLSGKLRPGRYGPELTNPKIAREEAPAAERMASGQWEPVYPATASISSAQVQRIVQRNLPRLLRLVEEFFPPQYLRRRKLIDRWLAVGWMHFPAMSSGPVQETAPNDKQGSDDEPALVLEPNLSNQEVRARHAVARRRLAWDEAFLFQLALALRRRTRQTSLRAVPLVCDTRIRQRILRRFPFPLTGAQLGAIDQIAADLAKPVPMNRLLQGDVGAGKTVVALFAALLAVAHGRQAAIMAPTEILAGQHHERISQYLRGSRVRWALLTGSVAAGERRRIHEQLAAGELDLVVGTSALISEGVRFARLAVVVIDEQHKFGVQQRAELQHGHFGSRISDFGFEQSPPGQSETRNPQSEIPHTAPHTLVMTATPIPRSLALTVFGDLAVSVIDKLPPGRGQTQTRVVAQANREAAMTFIEQRLSAGGQAFFVCPRVGAAEGDGQDDAADAGESESRESMASAEQAFRELAPRFDRFGMALVHGQMGRDRQQSAIAAFAAGRVRVLVATTVVEVGVDIARANVMAVLSAERFGLAQLHQLRGRIGRSADIRKSYCLLFVSQDESAGRLRIMEQTADGFRIAEEDLARRGPGQFFGVAQHGLPEFRFIDLSADLDLLRQVRQDAFKLVEADPTLSQSSHAVLRRHMQSAHGASLALVDAG